MFPNSKIVAYDIDPLARQRTQEMASANQIRVGDRFELKEYCTANDLLGLDPTSRHLIFFQIVRVLKVNCSAWR